MLTTTFRVVLDANVLFPFTLRDTLLRAAYADLYQVRWSAEILDETTRNLIGTGRMTDQQAQHLVEQMSQAFPEAMIEGYEPLTPTMLNDEKDRHVAAAAVKAGAEVIVTNNLKDFRNLPPGIEVQSPDTFLCDLFDLDPSRMVNLLRQQAGALKNPPRSFEELLVGLSKSTPSFIQFVREHLAGANHQEVGEER